MQVKFYLPMLDINTANFDKLIEIIKTDEKHCDYNTVCELAQLYKAMITGKDDDFIYRRFYAKLADSDDANEQALYQQLKRISNLILKPVCNRILQPFNKVPRSNAKTEILQYAGDEQGQRTLEMQNILDKFWGVKSFNDWMNSRFLELSACDPNSWVVIEFPSTDGTVLTQPYPFEVKSEDAIYFEYINEILQYLVAKGEEDNFPNYTIYGQDSVIKLQAVDKSRVKGLTSKEERVYVDMNKYETKIHYYIEEEEVYELQAFTDVEGNEFVWIGNSLEDFYLITEPQPHNLGYVNAFRVGYLRDLYTDGRTFINCFDVAIPYLMNTVKVSVEKDLTFALHAFPRRYQYEKHCTHEGCYNGHLSEGGTCPTCHGEGTLVTTSTQEVITIPLPNSLDGANLLDLTKLFAVDRPPTDIIQLQLDYIDSLTESAIAVIFNSDVFVKPNIKDTATSRILDYENVYDVLYPFAVNFAKIWTFGVYTIADIVDKGTGLIASMSFGRDFRFETKTELIDLYKGAKDAGMTADILNKIESKIVQIDNYDNKDEYLKWSVKKLFDPFNGKTPEEILYLLTSPEVPKSAKILYSNYGQIWDNVEMAVPKIWEMNKTKIRDLLYTELEKFIQLLDEEKPATLPMNFNEEETEDTEETTE